MKKIHRAGFTIVELLVVIVTIGILTAIAVVSYNGFVQRGHDAAVTSDLTNVSDQFDIFRTQSGILDAYPSTLAEVTSLGAKFSRNSYKTDVSQNILVCTSTDKKSFAIVAQSKSGKVLAATKDGVKDYTGDSSTFATNGCSTYSTSLVTVGVLGGTWQSWAGGS